MARTVDADLCVIGAGSAGLSVAAGASQLGAKTVLIEKGVMGGDCLNVGCVPSKTLLASAHAAWAVRQAGAFGIDVDPPRVDGAKIFARVRSVIAEIAPMDSVERFEGLGVDVVRAAARFTDARTVEAGGVNIRARRFVIATGSSPAVPPIPGLAHVPYLTNETIFTLDRLPEHLIVVGGGPIGIEMAQAFRRLGARVTVVEAATMMAQDDPELVDVVRQALRRDGVDIREGVRVERIEGHSGKVVAVLSGADGESRIPGTDLLIAAGRTPTIRDLGLDAAGIAHSATGITVDRRLRTSNRRVYAIGDVTSGPRFTHVASHHASVVIRNVLFRLPARVETRAVPRVTFTAPELAQVGLTEDETRRRGIKFRILRWPFADNDRARAEGSIDGHVKVVATPKGRVLGAGIVGPHAGEMINLWTLAIGDGIKLGRIAQMIVPYPTWSEAGKRAAGSFFTPTLFSERAKSLVRFLARFG